MKTITSFEKRRRLNEEGLCDNIYGVGGNCDR